jgi:DNA-binding transcriptional LysR family regulator
MPRNPITIEVLETLDAIDRRGSFARAAEELNKATSAISYTVQKLEEQLDITLFQREGRRSVLTPAGKVVLHEGREILNSTVRLADKAREVAMGWEPRIAIAVETLQPLDVICQAMNEFLNEHPAIELDMTETVLNGGWELLDQDVVDLVIGSPGPPPRQKGYRTVPLASPELVAVIASKHKLAQAAIGEQADRVLGQLRTVVTHDTSKTDITRSAGITSDGKRFYVQNAQQKTAAIVAGIGVGHLPKGEIADYLKDGTLLTLPYSESNLTGNFMAWKLSNKGKGLKALTSILSQRLKQ